MRLHVPLSIAAALPAVAHAGVFAYATNYRQELCLIDLTSPTTVVVGNLGFTAQGLATTSNGNLYATDPSGNLFQVNGGTPIPIAPLGALQVGALDSAGTSLWGFDNASSRFFEYSVATLSFLQWSPAMSLPDAVHAMALDANGDFLISSGYAGVFQKVDKATWGVTTIKNGLGLADQCEGLDFLSDGNLYAVILGDDRYRIDPATGNVLSVVPEVVHHDWGALTAVSGISPTVPGPPALAAFGLGLLARRRRRP